MLKLERDFYPVANGDLLCLTCPASAGIFEIISHHPLNTNHAACRAIIIVLKKHFVRSWFTEGARESQEINTKRNVFVRRQKKK